MWFVLVDKCIYVICDVMVIVELVVMIIVLILLKKFVVGFDGFVMDVKVGFGVFMLIVEKLVELVCSIVDVGNGVGMKMIVIFIDMN